MKKHNLTNLFITISILSISYILWNLFIIPETNSYIGINMKCKFCHKNKGSHSHSLDKSNFSTKHENIASTGHMCPVCKQNPGSLHVHIDDIKPYNK